MEFDPYWQEPTRIDSDSPEIRAYTYTRRYRAGEYRTYKSILWIQGKECGSFIIGGIGGFHSGHTMSMEIFIDEEHQKKGYSMLLIRTLCKFISNMESNGGGQLLFIDTDASVGFWDRIGMKPNRYYDRFTPEREGGGYEKFITFEELCKV
jgi:GNAT superfamily N-acetyltransferase